MNNNQLTLKEVLSNSAVAVLDQELKIAYYRLNQFNAFAKAGDNFNADDWGFCLSLFSVGYLNCYIQNRLDGKELDMHSEIFSSAQSKFLNIMFPNQNLDSIILKIWFEIDSDSDLAMFYKSGIIAGDKVNGIYKDVAFIFTFKHKLL